MFKVTLENITLLKQLGFKGTPSSILFPIHEGSALVVDHVISVYVTESSEDCELKCYLEDDCMSINIEPKGDGTYYYELSDSDHVLHPQDLENRKDVIDRSVQGRISLFN